MQRRALIVAGGAGPEDTVASVLHRFGFMPSAHTSTLGDALGRLRKEHFDLLIIPIQDIEPVQLLELEREIRGGKGAPVIGTAPKPDPDLIVRAMRAGIADVLVNPPDPKDLAAAVDRLMRRTPSEMRRGQMIAVYSGKGGLGTTTIAVNLAQALAKHRADARMALVDLVVTGGDVKVFLNLKPTYDVGDLVAKLDRVDAELLYSLLTPRPGGVWALPSGDSPELDDMINGSTVGAIIEGLRTHFAFTVLDCEHHLTDRTVAALDAADRVLLVTQLIVPALRSTQRTIALCRRLGYTDEKLCVVVNRYQSGEVLSLADAKDVLKAEVFWKLPNDYKLASAALDKGVPVSELDPHAKLSGSFAQLAARLGGAADPGAPRSNGRPSESRFGRLFGIKKGGK